jgi:hypothetical protein
VLFPLAAQTQKIDEHVGPLAKIKNVRLIMKKTQKKLIKNNKKICASIHKNQTAKPPKIAPKLFPLPPTITITQIKKVYLIGL